MEKTRHDLTDREAISGSEALAWGVIEAGVQFVIGHPGSPGSAVVDELLRLKPSQMRIEWASNERSAFDAAFGASLAGVRSMVCFKSVGLNVALDSLMVCNLAGGDGGFVILTGDDPGGYGSQNEEDSRPIIAAAEIPLLEPSTVAEGRSVVKLAFKLSERIHTPVAVRITQPMMKDTQAIHQSLNLSSGLTRANFERQEDRWTVTPSFVVSYHQKLVETMHSVQAEFEDWGINQIEGDGQLGILAPGYAYTKLAQVLDQGSTSSIRIMKLGTLHPLPERRIASFLQGLDAVLVIEEIVPHLESLLPSIAFRAGMQLPIYGRHSGHIPAAGELLPQHISDVLQSFLPDWPAPASLERPKRHMISTDPLCEGCPYIPGFGTLLQVMEHHGGRDDFVITGESGCMIRAQVSRERILDTKFAMGSSIGIAAGLARTGISQKVIALAGDTAFLHTGWGELMDAVHAGVDLLVVLLDNATAAISGGQPHAAIGHDLHGTPRKPVDLVALIKAAGVSQVQVVDPADIQVTQAAYEAGITTPGVSVVVIRHPCPIFAKEVVPKINI
jgi:indolepyruvate ferredoxin oxidoreductase, alpha subunit